MYLYSVGLLSIGSDRRPQFSLEDILQPGHEPGESKPGHEPGLPQRGESKTSS